MRINTGILALVSVAVLGGGYFLWTQTQGSGLPEGIASGNGQIEAVQVDIASMVAGRVESVTVKEGDLVHPGQVVATIEDKAIRAQVAQAQAQVAAAEAQVAAAEAQVAQAQAVLDLALEEGDRARELAERGTTSQSQLDARETEIAVDRANLAAAKAALEANRRSVDAARAAADQAATNLDYTELSSPVLGRVLYRLAEPGEVIAAGSKVLTLVDLSEVYMEFFLPATQAHRVAIGSEARIRLDVVDAVVPATVTFVSPVSQYTPRSVETADERQNLMFRMRVRVPQELVEAYIDLVRTGVRGVAYVQLSPVDGSAPTPWPAELTAVELPDLPARSE